MIAGGSLLLLSNVGHNPNNSNLANTTSSDCDLWQWKALLAEGQGRVIGCRKSLSAGNPPARNPSQEAKARFSERIDEMLEKGPQVLSRRGIDAAVIVSMDELAQAKKTKTV